MKVTDVIESQDYSKKTTEEIRERLITVGQANAEKVGYKNSDGIFVKVKDTGESILISKRGLRHAFGRRFSFQSSVIEKIGEVIENAIEINNMCAKKKEDMKVTGC